MTIKGQITEKEYMAFQRLNMRQSKIVDIIDTLIVCLTLTALTIVWTHESDPRGSWIYYLPLFLILLAFPVLRLIVLPWRWRRVFAQDSEIQLPVAIELREEGIHVKNDIGESTRPWTHYRRWKEGDGLLILYLADNRATPLPKRWFAAEELAFIHEKLESHAVPKARPLNAVSCVTYLGFGLIILVILAALALRALYVILA